MTTSVLEHIVPNQATFSITAHENARLVSISKHGNDVVLCCIEDSTLPTHDYPFLRFEAGEALPTDIGKERYVGSYEAGATLFHLFQDVSEFALEV